MTDNIKLLDKDAIINKHPALGERKYRLEYLVRSRLIPVIKIGKRIYFDEVEIQKWIENQKVPAMKGHIRNG